jgi:predicted MFS family arabinose efflux permease
VRRDLVFAGIACEKSKAISLRDFNWLWAGQTLSLFGSAVSRLAIPTVAIFALHASAFAVGALGATTYIAFPILGVFAGVWVDRWPRRVVLIASDIVRATALATVPLAAALHALALGQLFGVALVTSIASVFFDVAYQAHLPELVPIERLADANARLELSNSAAQIAGSATAGGLIAALGASLTVAVDAASFGFSVITLLLIGRAPAAPRAAKQVANFGRELREGLASVFSNAALLRIVACTATSNLGSAMLDAVFLIFVYRHLHLSPSIVGIIFALGNAGFVGAFFAPRIVKRWGLPSTLIWSMAIAAVVQVCIPLSAFGFAIPLLIVKELVTSAAVPVYNISQVSWRQSTVPAALQGRMNATVRTIAWGTLPLGAFIGGALVAPIGIVATLIVATIVEICAVIWLLSADVRALAQRRQA